MGEVSRMVDRANAVIADAPPGTDASMMADDLLEVVGMYRKAWQGLEESARTMSRMAYRIMRLETLLELCEPYLPSASGIERDVRNALNMVRESPASATQLPVSESTERTNE